METLEGKITILFSDEGLRIEVNDVLSGIQFLTVRLNQKQTCEALSRLSHTHCKIEVCGLDRVGKLCERENFEFEIESADYGNRKDIAAETVKKVCPAGWTPSTYFGSQNSFFSRDGKTFARTHISRWVDPPPSPQDRSD